METTTTDDLLKELLSAKDIESFLAGHKDKLTTMPPLSEYLNALLAQKGLIVADVIRDANLTHNDYQYFYGRRHPPREKVLLLAFGFHLDFRETQKLLHIANAGALYIKNRRDSIIIFALKKHKNLKEASDLLADENEEPLIKKD